jgi:hypothetical protein
VVNKTQHHGQVLIPCAWSRVSRKSPAEAS